MRGSANDGRDLVGQTSEYLGPAVQARVDEDDFVVVTGCSVTEHGIAESVESHGHRVR